MCAKVGNPADALSPVVNIKTGAAHDVYIGRGKNSPWGNPFSHRPDTLALFRVETRDEAIEAHRAWLWKQIQDGKISLSDLAALHGKTLGCFCKPSACHGDTLARAARWAYRELEARKEAS